jgi:tetratricopeptide (TPR) repeat protein
MGRRRAERRGRLAPAPRSEGSRAAPPPARASATTRSARIPALALGIVVLTATAYGPAFRAGWVWDDDSYVTANATLRSWDGLARIWSEPGAVAQYYPLTFSSLWLDYQLHGADPFAYHATNVGVHAANAVLVGVVLDALAIPAPWVAAALFAIHPMHVESVAWVTERKNVLSGCFYLLAFLALLRWRERADAAPHAGRTWYAVGFVCFVAALLSKTVTSTLPVVFLVVRWWRTGRVRREEVVAMVPFLLAGFALGSVTASLERTHVGAVGVHWDQTFAERVLIAGRALWFYAGKLLVPWPLVFIYPRWSLDVGSIAQWLFPVAAALAGAGLLAAVRRLGRAPFAAALAFAVTLAPALGFVNVYPMRYSFVADHFAYLASIPFLALAVAMAARHLTGSPGRLLAASVALVLVALTWSRATAFHDAGALWRDTLAKNPEATIAYVNLGYQTYEAGRPAEALALYDRGLALEPDAADLLNDRGLALGALGRTEEAIASYERARRADPTHVEARSNLGNTLASLGRYDAAETAYRDALRLRPGFAEAHNNLANVLALRGDTTAAIEEYARAIAADPGYVDPHRNLGEVLLQVGRPGDACARFDEALRLRPREIVPTVGRMRCLAALGRLQDAITVGTDALAWAPNAPAVRLALARLLEQAGRTDEAAVRRREAIALDPSLAGAERP